MGRRRWTPDEKAALVAQCVTLGTEGWTQRAIGAHLGLHQTLVSKWLRLPGIVYRPGTHAPELVPPPLRRVVIDLAEVFDEVVKPRLDAYRNGERG